MVFEVEDALEHVLRSDNQIPIEEPKNSSVNKHIQLSFFYRENLGKEI